MLMFMLIGMMMSMGMIIMAVIVLMMRMVVLMRVLVLMTVMVMMLRIAGMLLVAVEVSVSFLAVEMIARLMIMAMRQVGLDVVRAGCLDDAALDAVAIAAAARIAVARAAAVGAVFGLFFGFAMGAFVCFDQRLTVGDRDLVVVGMDFAEGQEAMAVAAILDKGRLQ